MSWKLDNKRFNKKTRGKPFLRKKVLPPDPFSKNLKYKNVTSHLGYIFHEWL